MDVFRSLLPPSDPADDVCLFVTHRRAEIVMLLAELPDELFPRVVVFALTGYDDGKGHDWSDLGRRAIAQLQDAAASYIAQQQT